MPHTDRNAPWRKQMRDAMSAKERTALPRVEMPMQNAAQRVNNFNEVNIGLSPAQAQAEASRCLDCPEPACIQGCPVSIDIPSFIKNIQHGNIADAAAVLAAASALPAVCGRVCP
ncbi:MAG: bifunctional dihydroorotate dehydrogenase B NAD binding subunit/NADPH-dependent glutamate synthase, partial [Muribaculaceae bacterium]|nr:bifunctional dihydroorotate dehydrogenase B NAD binding subunit/NADPH-dependent glutamate synthase [Muribaculaceae bacterium]